MKKIILTIIIVFGFLATTYLLYSYLMQIGVDEGYEPVQPIHFSHKIHAGDNKIDCKYCHSAARSSAVAGVPSLNVCMGCHNTISEYEGEEDLANGYTKDFYTAEIKKLYTAVGWDEQQFKYTGKEQAVEWVRIHKLPDFTYFNHSQHVTVAGLKCDACHGAVDKMEVVRQEAPLTMGWCVECHRTSKMNMEHPYYANYEQVHRQLAKTMQLDSLTVEHLGGLECAKCHY